MRGSALYKHILSGDTAAFKKCLSQQNADSLYDTNKKGQTYLHCAVDKGAVGVVEFLLENYNLDINARDISGWTPLHSACNMGSCTLVETILKHGSDIDFSLRSLDQSTPLHYFVRRCVEEDLEKGARYYNLLRKIIEKGCDVNAQNVNGDTALHVAADKGHAGCIRVLVQNGARINLVNKYGEIPLHLSTRNGYARAVAALLELGADTQLEGKGGTAKQIALTEGHKDILKMINKEETARQERVQRLIDSANDSGTLSLTNLSLHHLPPALFTLNNLQELNLSNNLLTEIPSSISKLTNLRLLRLDENRLTDLPKALGSMTQLTSITLSLNPDLAPNVLRAYRMHDLPGFLTFLSRHIVTSQEKSVGDFISATDLRPEEDSDSPRWVPVDSSEDSTGCLQNKQMYLSSRERKIAETIAILQEQNALFQDRRERLIAKEQFLKAKEKKLDSLEQELLQKESALKAKEKELQEREKRLKKKGSRKERSVQRNDSFNRLVVSLTDESFSSLRDRKPVHRRASGHELNESKKGLGEKARKQRDPLLHDIHRSPDLFLRSREEVVLANRRGSSDETTRHKGSKHKEAKTPSPKSPPTLSNSTPEQPKPKDPLLKEKQQKEKEQEAFPRQSSM